MRHVLAAEARRQRDALVAATARIDLGLDRRRRRRQHHRNFRDVPAHHRHVARVIVRAFVLLVGLVVLFIDDDEAEIGVGQHQRRARADHHMRLARGDRRPVARARARRQLRMPFMRPHAEARREAIEELAGQRDLRHQDQRLPALAQDFGDRLEIDFGLARAGHAVEQRDAEFVLRRERAHRLRGRLLLRRKIRHGEFRIGRRRRHRLRQRQRFQRAFVDQAVDHAGADAGFQRRLRLRPQHAVRQQRDHPPPRRRHALRRRARRAARRT